LVDSVEQELETPSKTFERMTPKERAKAEIDAAPPVSTGEPKVPSQYKDAKPGTDQSQKKSGTNKGQGKQEREKKAKKAPKFSRNELSYDDALEVYNRQMRDINELKPEQIEYVQPEMPALYKKETKKSGKRRKGLGKGFDKLLTKEQRKELAHQQMLDAVRSANESLRDTQRRQEAANRANNSERLTRAMEAGRQLNQNLSKSRNEIVDYAREANDGADLLTADQLRRSGLTQEELDRLGLSHLLPPSLRFGNGVDAQDVAQGNEPYLAYSRVRGGGGIDDIIKQRDKEVADQISVFTEQADSGDLVSLEDKFVNGVAPQEIGAKDMRVDRMRKSRIETQRAFLNPLRLFKNIVKVSTLKDESGNDVNEQGFKYVRAGFDQETENAISKVSEVYHGISITSCLQLVMIRGGIGYDNFVNMKPKMRNAVIVELCQDLVMSERINGLPNNMVTGSAYSRNVRDDKGYVVFGGTRCFPFGYIPSSLLQEIINAPGSKFAGMTVRQVRKLEWEQFMNQTYPDIYANATQPQLAAYRNAMTALMELDGQNPNYFDIPLDSEKTIMQLYEDQKGVNDEAVSAGTWACSEEIKEMARQANDQYWHRPKKHRSSEGSNAGGHDSSIAYEKTSGNSDVSNTMKSVAGYLASNGAMSLQTMATAPFEGGIVAYEDWVSNRIDRALTDILGGNKNVDMTQYEMTDYLRSMMSTQEGKECLDVMSALYQMDGMGWDIVALYNESGYKLTKSDLTKFVNELHGMEGKLANFNDVIRNVEHFWRKFQMGEGLFRGSDTRQWCDRTLKMMSEYASQGETVGVFTNQQMEDAISQGGVEKFMREMLFNSKAAQDSFMFTGLNSFNSKNWMSSSVQRVFNANGVTKFAFGALISKYPTYYVNKMFKDTVPFSNSISYLTASLGTWLGTDMGDGSMNSMAKYFKGTTAGLGSVDFTKNLLRNERWLDGLRRNLIYDAVHIGNKFIMTQVFKCLIGALGGLGLPDDDENKYLMEEYRIGGADGVPTKLAWWMDDIIGCSLPLAYALYLHENGAVDRNGNHVDVDLETCQNIAFYGITKNSNASVLLDAISMVNDVDANMENLALMCDDPESYAKVIEGKGNMPSSLGEYTAATIEHYLVANTLRNSMPRLMNQLIPMNKGFIFRDQSKDAKTAWSVWNTEGTQYDPDGRTKKEAMATYETTSVGYREGRIRTDSQDNFLYALLNDAFRIGFDTEKTGYMYEEQAVGTKSDARALQCYEEYYFDPWELKDDEGNALSDEQLEVTEHQLADKLISDLRDNYGNPYEAAADGFVIPPVARFNAMNYCWYLYDEEKAKYDQFVKANPYLSYQEKKQAWEPVQAIYDEYCDPYSDMSVYGKWLNSDIIPSEIPKYIKQESTYNERWIVGEGETARAATPAEVVSGEAHKEMYAYGDEPNAFLPATQPRQQGKGFNYETPSYWDVPGWTDREAIAEQLRGKSTSLGMDAGIDLEQLYFGGQPDLSLRIPANGDQQTTISRRNYREPLESVLPDILKNPTKESVESYLGVKSHIPTSDDEKDEKTDTKPSYDNAYPFGGYGGGYTSYYRGGGGGGYGGGGGSGSSYNPRIYNTPRQVYSSKPAAMQTKAPYKATTTYLRPAFYTKGSREAYRRQDI